MVRLLLFPLGLAVAVAVAAAQYDPPAPRAPDPSIRKALEERIDRLGRAVGTLRGQGVRDPQLADVEVYHKAGVWLLRHGEFYGKDSAAWALGVLDRGLLRASQLGRGEAPWLQQWGQAVARAYRSNVDGSLQPYAVTYPADYVAQRDTRWRLDVVLHGRDASLTEVKFLHQHRGDRPAPSGQKWVQLDIFGRGNNAYRWAGESDVYEAIQHFLAVERLLGRGNRIDTNRVVLRGFSMGGAGTWHLGLHRPDQWVVLGPGAGFTTTHGYVKGLPDPLPPEQEACLHIYDAVDYAENAFDVPVVAYAGSEDAQLQAARNIEQRLHKLGIPMTLLVAPGLGHKFPPEWQQKAEAAYEKYTRQGRTANPQRVRFVTWTLKYPRCDWVDVMALDRHYRRTHVDAERSDAGFTVKTANVRVLRLALPPGATRDDLTLEIDGQKLVGRPHASLQGELFVYLEKHDGRWRVALPERLVVDRLRTPQKMTGLQGPIDDAFTAPFLCVRGTGKPWHPAAGRYAEANLERFRAEWSKYLRGDLPVKDDEDVTAADIATHHLILFGDPSSNSLIAQALPGLPVQWTQEQVVWKGKSYPAAEHVPVLIYPSPLAADRYLVLNSGHTFHAPDFKGTNALLYPRLGDHALLRLPGKEDPLAVEVVEAGLFDDFWRTERPAKP